MFAFQELNRGLGTTNGRETPKLYRRCWRDRGLCIEILLHKSSFYIYASISLLGVSITELLRLVSSREISRPSHADIAELIQRGSGKAEFLLRVWCA